MRLYQGEEEEEEEEEEEKEESEEEEEERRRVSKQVNWCFTPIQGYIRAKKKKKKKKKSTVRDPGPRSQEG